MRRITLSKTCETVLASGEACGAPRVRIMGYSDGGRGDFFDRAECGRHAFIPREPKFSPLVSTPRGAFGWPLVAHPAPLSPGEMTLACPVCRSTSVIRTGTPGHDGRMGSPGEGSRIDCQACGKSAWRASTRDHRTSWR